MRIPTAFAGLSLLVIGLAACGGGDGIAPQPVPTALQEIAQPPLTAADLQMFLAVRSKALLRLEDAVAAVEGGMGDVVTRVQELSVAEHEAAAALGASWERYSWVRDEIGRLMAAQRQREDATVLAGELTRAREDLAAQIAVARDQASRQFLEAQLQSLKRRLEELGRDRALPPLDAQQLSLLDTVRAEIAVQQGREERIQRRLRDLLQRNAPVATAGSGRK